MANSTTKYSSSQDFAQGPEQDGTDAPTSSSTIKATKAIKAIYSREQGIIVAHLRRAREEAGVTQADLAKALGFVNHSPVSKIESGQVRVDLVVLQRICRALGISFRRFVLQVVDDLENVTSNKPPS